MIKVFFSYSHRDEELRNELETHLAILKRQGVIEAWHDRRILAGSNLGQSIDEHLESADLILLLVSPDFLASDYCYDIEMQRALERHQSGEAQVVPIILRPCDWHSAHFGNLLAVPPDGKPVVQYPDRDEGFLTVVQAIRRLVDDLADAGIEEETVCQSVAPMVVSSHVPETRSSNLRIKKEFSDREKDQFIDQSFNFMATFFENSLAELQARNPSIETDFSRIDAKTFISSAYVDGKRAARCSIWTGGDNSFFGDIVFAFGESRNSANEALSLVEDGYSLYLRAFGMQMSGGMQDKHLTQEGAAEFFWGIFIDQLQR